MALLTQSGRTALAVSLHTQPVHLAWGTGDAAWETSHTQSFTFEANQIALPHAPVKNVTLADVADGYSVDLQTGVITRQDASVPDTVTVAYTVATPPEAMQATSLVYEVGRRVMDTICFCTPDPEGLLVTPTGRFSESTVPTNQLYFRCTFDFQDGATETIRELGIFIGTEISDACPPGQRYFLPTDLANPGILLVLENTVPLIRTPATREAFSFVVTL